jgi:hypothetical protein
MFSLPLIIGVIVLVVISLISKTIRRRHTIHNLEEPFKSDALMRELKSRRDYYNDVYLKSDEWRRKRYVVLRRDKWRCVHCRARATEVHHKKYAPKNIGKEPIEWLESVCRTCHDSLHHR